MGQISVIISRNPGSALSANQQNRLVDMAQQGKNSVVPYSLHRCVELLDEAFAGGTSGKALTNLRKIMTKKPIETEGDLDRPDME